MPPVKVDWTLVISCSDRSILFEFDKEILDKITCCIQYLIVVTEFFSVVFRGNYYFYSSLSQRPNDSILHHKLYQPKLVQLLPSVIKHLLHLSHMVGLKLKKEWDDPEHLLPHIFSYSILLYYGQYFPVLHYCLLLLHYVDER